ncbi:hypothetical protein M569_03304 [Genlisea aurea]|uniref:FAS1 domain-containing protein n=1 Tax=Genlisea aurea TaxID=192259 RepID=S8D259_9LAMI|nr:hypothetical protein M569_03304 [Genlisea aurea]
MAIFAVSLPLFAVVTALCTAAAAAAATTVPPPSANASLIAAVLNDLGFQELAAAAAQSSNFPGGVPITVFAPTRSSLMTCPSCSVPLILREHSVPGIYRLPFLRTLAFGTKIASFAGLRCITVTRSPAFPDAAVFINGVEITKPDLFTGGGLVVHGIQGFVSHLSPASCAVESMATLSFPQIPPPTAAFLAARSMLKEAMTALRTTGYSTAALAMRVLYPTISDLRNMTVFAVDDESIFVDGSHNYVAELGFHIIPDRLITAAELLALPAGAVLPTMDRGRTLAVTTAGGGGPLHPMRINYVKVKKLSVVTNDRVVVHGVVTPFPLLYVNPAM